MVNTVYPVLSIGGPQILVEGTPVPGQVMTASGSANASWNHPAPIPPPTPPSMPGGVTYQEGGTNSGFVFNTFAGALAAIQTAGVPAPMYIDGSMGQPAVLAGT